MTVLNEDYFYLVLRKKKWIHLIGIFCFFFYTFLKPFFALSPSDTERSHVSSTFDARISVSMNITPGERRLRSICSALVSTIKVRASLHSQRSSAQNSQLIGAGTTRQGAYKGEKNERSGRVEQYKASVLPSFNGKRSDYSTFGRTRTKKCVVTCVIQIFITPFWSDPMLRFVWHWAISKSASFMCVEQNLCTISRQKHNEKQKRLRFGELKLPSRLTSARL